MSDLTSASPELYGEAAGAGANIAFPHEPSARYATTIGLTVRPEDAHAAHNAFSWLAAKASAEWVQLLAADLFRRIRARPAGRAGPASGRRRLAQGFLQDYQRLLGV